MPEYTPRYLKSYTLKDANVQGQTLCGAPAVMGNLDLVGDVIFPGAFKKCLGRFLQRGFTTRDHEWTAEAMLGYPTVAEERGRILYSEFRFHSTPDAQAVLTKCRERLAANMGIGQSVGFEMGPGGFMYFPNGKALLGYARSTGYDLKLFDVAGIEAYTEQCCGILEVAELWEYSITPVPANPLAQGIQIKSGVLAGVNQAGKPTMTPLKIKSICGDRSAELAPRDTKWSATEAIKRVKAHVGADDEPNKEFAKAFVVCDGPTDEFGSYKLPFLDVIGGETKAVPKAIFAIAEVLQGARGGVDLSDTDREGAKRLVEHYYDLINKQSGGDDDKKVVVPWAKDTAEKRWKGMYLGQYVEHDMCLSAMQAAYYSLMYEVSDCLMGLGEYKDMDDTTQYDSIEGMFDEHKDLCMSMIKAIAAGDGQESAEDMAKSLQRAAAQLCGLGDGLPYTTHARLAVDASAALIDRTKARCEMRSKDGRTLSEANRQTLKEHRDALQDCVKTIDELLESTMPKDKGLTDRLTALRLDLLSMSVAGESSQN